MVFDDVAGNLAQRAAGQIGEHSHDGPAAYLVEIARRPSAMIPRALANDPIDARFVHFSLLGMRHDATRRGGVQLRFICSRMNSSIASTGMRRCLPILNERIFLSRTSSCILERPRRRRAAASSKPMAAGLPLSSFLARDSRRAAALW